MNDTGQREEIRGRFLTDLDLTDLSPGDFDLALTHRSFAYETGAGDDNERLEFLGDAFIGAITSEYLFTTHPEASEGELSKRRARLVSRHLLGRRAQQLGLGELLRLGRGERDSGGAERLSTLGSALEALVGTVYLRLGFERARRFVLRQLLEGLVGLETSERSRDDFKSLLQEWAQQHAGTVPIYTRLGEEGPDHEKRFFVEVSLGGQVLAKASGARIKHAENEAARLALEQLERGNKPLS